jgi:signal transduction histidine kinase
LFKDLEAVRQIPIVPNMLEVICDLTGMGFAAVARVTETRWLACQVRDLVKFGLREGDELKIETTICNEIRDSRQLVVIDNVQEDPDFKDHHTPKMYGLQSYISVPILLKDGTFFGTLCAIDSKPAKVKDPKIVGTFTMFAELLSFHLQTLLLLEQSHETNRQLHQQNEILTNVNNDLDTFVYTASHDLKSPLSNVEGLLDVLSVAISKENIDKNRIKKVIDLMGGSLKRFSATIKDLTNFIESNNFHIIEESEHVNVLEVVENVKQDLERLIMESKATIKVEYPDNILLQYPKRSFKSILYNLISNALKYHSPERLPEVVITLNKAEGKTVLTVADNGLGIPEDKVEKLFTMFKRFHSHVEGSGLGLYMVKRMIDNMNGRIHVDSTENRGTTFTLVF